jgi:DNA-binding protein HU-beta
MRSPERRESGAATQPRGPSGQDGGLSIGDAFHFREGLHIMNNSDLIEKIAASNEMSKADAKAVVDAVFAAITEAAVAGEEIALNGFGKFKVKDSPAREGRNPSTGETIQIAASKKVGFTPAKALKDRLNG